MGIIATAKLTYPECGTAQHTEVLTDAYQFFRECVHCHYVLKPQPGHCWVELANGASSRIRMIVAR